MYRVQIESHTLAQMRCTICPCNTEDVLLHLGSDPIVLLDGCSSSLPVSNWTGLDLVVIDAVPSYAIVCTPS